jgi:hypothetical protein
MERSGMIRRAMQARGHYAVSCDLEPADDIDPALLGVNGGHIRGDVFDVLDLLGHDFELAIFHPDCTYLTCSAEWAYKDGPYHQKTRPSTLLGAERRKARALALDEFRRLLALPIGKIAIKNPVGAASRMVRKPDQTIQPYEFGDDASKRTCLWLKGLPLLIPTGYVHPRMVNGRSRWANQTDSGQNRLPPSAERAMAWAVTYPGIAAAMAGQWAGP